MPPVYHFRRAPLLRILALPLLLGLGAGPAGATVRSDPVQVRLTGQRPVAEAGATLRVSFELRAAETVVVENLRIEGDGWRGRPVEGPPGLAVTAASPSNVRFDCVASRPSSPLVVACEVGGKTWRFPFDLSSEGAAARRGRPVRSAGSPPERPRLPAGSPALLPAPPAGPSSEMARQAGGMTPHVPDPAATTQAVTIRGSLVYLRFDNMGMGADGVTVRIFDWNPGIVVPIGVTVTDAWGHFEYTVNWSSSVDPYPDLFVQFEAANSWVSVCPEGDDDAYAWVTPIRMDYAGAELDLHGLTPADESQFPALHILTDLVRDRRWHETGGFPLMPFVRTRWPVTGTNVSHYDRNAREIHITPDHQWDEIVHGHEYGHLLFHLLDISPPPDYCLPPNYCDADPPDDCGHCTWCPEDLFSQWTEAGPTWLAVLQCQTYGPVYGLPASSPFQCESLQVCIDSGYLHHPVGFTDPLTTEGFGLAFLYDLCDAVNERDTAAAVNGVDELTMSPSVVLDAIVADRPVLLSMFFGSFSNRHPELRESLWATAMNNRFDFDVGMPGEVANLHSTSHAIGVPSPDDTPTFVWDRAPDDLSGVAGYCMSLTHSPGSPGFDRNVPDTTRFTVAPLEPGEWYVNLRAVDRAGHWSTDWQSAGPYRIRERTPADLEPWTPAGWAGPLVPRPAADATSGSAPYPTALLPGNDASTWWNAGSQNSGEAGAGDGTWDRLYLDGEPVDSIYYAYLAGGAHAYALNHGPLTVRGGRHTLAMVHDDGEAVLESDESNNVVGRQWVWQPRVMSVALHHRPAPSHPQGGFFQVTNGATFYSNCDGLRMDLSANSAPWQLAYVRPDSANGNLVVQLFAAASSPTAGFDVPLASSNRGNGRVNAVLVHKRNAGSTTLWDVGVARNNGVLSGYLSRKVTSTSLAAGDSLRHTFSGGQDMRLFDYAPEAGAAGWHTVRIRKISGPGTVHAAWYDNSFLAGRLADYDELEMVSDTGTVGFLDVNVTSTVGGYGIAVWRDRCDGEDPVEVEIELERTQPDFEPWLSDIFYSPLVPTPAPTSPGDSVLVPATLPGNTASTYLNMVVRNDSNGQDPAGPYASVDVDGGLAFWVKVNPLVPHVIYPFRISAPVTVRGGRHSLSVEWDRDDAIGERDEENNGFGEQWVWSPLTVQAAVPVTRAIPPARTGGWDEITAAPYGLFYNCDGLRTPRSIPVGNDGYWIGAAVLPGAASDVDVRLHEIRSGTQEGFRTNLGRSGWGDGLSDFCLANFRLGLPRSLDVGVLHMSGDQAYDFEYVTSGYLGTNPARTFGPFELGEGHLLRLHEVYLSAGRWEVELLQYLGSQNVDWGLSLHSGAVKFPTKSEVVPDGSAWFAGSGSGESMVANVPADGYYCIAVWKSGARDGPLNGLYRLRVERSLLDAPPATPPARTALGPAYPNPTGGRCRVAFDLARSSHVSVVVYDLRGARVRTLCDGEMPAGRHEAAWNGEDASGAAAAPGVYLIRFAADGVEGVRRVVRLE